MSSDATQVPPDVPAAWAAGADALARWAWNHLVNRTDVWGGYRPPHLRTQGCKVWTLPARKDRGRVVLTLADLRAHFLGRRERDVRGLHSTSPANTCRWVGWDLDAHREEHGVGERNLRAALCWLARLERLGFRVLLMDSNGGGGFHLLLVFREPVPSPLAYRFAQWVIRDWKAMGFRTAPEAFPKQPRLEKTGSGRGACGNWMRLPGRHHTRMHWTRVWATRDGRWLQGEAAVQAILDYLPNEPARIPLAQLPEPSGAKAPLLPSASKLRTCRPRAGTRSARELALECLDHLNNGGEGLDYDRWFRVGAALHSVDSGSAMFEVFERWSAGSAKYDAGKTRETWGDYRGGRERRTTLGSLVRWSREAGHDPLPRVCRPRPSRHATPPALRPLPQAPIRTPFVYPSPASACGGRFAVAPAGPRGGP